MISHYKDPDEPINIMKCHKGLEGFWCVPGLILLEKGPLFLEFHRGSSQSSDIFSPLKGRESFWQHFREMKVAGIIYPELSACKYLRRPFTTKLGWRWTPFLTHIFCRWLDSTTIENREEFVHQAHWWKWGGQRRLKVHPRCFFRSPHEQTPCEGGSPSSPGICWAI